MIQELARAREKITELKRIQRDLRGTIDRLTEIASTDALTGLTNRRRFCDLLQTTYAISAERGLELSLLMIDVDWFKPYNDAYGHTAGDEVLRRFAERLQSTSRNHDIVSRYGGEEFAILLPLTDAAEALKCAERHRQVIGAYHWPLRSVTASFGVATMGPATASPAALIEHADRALYHAKLLGRNRSCHYENIAAPDAAAGAHDGLWPEPAASTHAACGSGPAVPDRQALHQGEHLP